MRRFDARFVTPPDRIIADVAAELTPSRLFQSHDLASPIIPVVSPTNAYFSPSINPLISPVRPIVVSRPVEAVSLGSRDIVTYDSILKQHQALRAKYQVITECGLDLLKTSVIPRKAPHVLMYALPRADMARVLLCHYAWPGRYNAPSATFIAKGEFDNAAWRRAVAAYVENTVLLVPCDPPESTDNAWFDAHIIGSPVILCTYETTREQAPMASDLTVVGFGFVTSRPVANTLDPAYRVRGGRQDDFARDIDANSLLVPVHMVCMYVTPPTTIQGILKSGNEIEDAVAVPLGRCASLPPQLEILAHDLTSPASIFPAIFMMLLRYGLQLDRLDLTRRHDAIRRIIDMLWNEADPVLIGDDVNATMNKRIKKMPVMLQKHALNVRGLNLYSDYDTLSIVHSALV